MINDAAETNVAAADNMISAAGVIVTETTILATVQVTRIHEETIPVPTMIGTVFSRAIVRADIT